MARPYAIKQILSCNRCPATVERITIESHRGCLNDRYHPRRRTAVVPPGDFETATVLQRQHHRVERKMRLNGSRAAFGVCGLHAKEHELRALHRAPFGAGRDANVFVEGLRFEPEPLTLDRLDELRAPD